MQLAKLLSEFLPIVCNPKVEVNSSAHVFWGEGVGVEVSIAQGSGGGGGGQLGTEVWKGQPTHSPSRQGSPLFMHFPVSPPLHWNSWVSGLEMGIGPMGFLIPALPLTSFVAMAKFLHPLRLKIPHQ